MITYEPSGVCTKKITFEIEGNVIKNVKFYAGCSGNLQGISRLIEGMSLDEAIERLKGIKCGDKETSCPDQLAIALERARNSGCKL